MEYKVMIGSVEYGMADIQSVKIESPLFEQFSAGNACASELEITFWSIDAVPRMATIVPFARKSPADAWSQLGLFYTDERSVSGDKMKIIAYDSMLKSEIVWTPNQYLTFPMTMTQAVNEIASLMGVQIDPRTQINGSYTVDYPANDYTLRDVLRFIASAHMGNWIITSENKLLLVPLFDSAPEETNYLVSEDGDSIVFGGVRIIV